MTKERIVVGMSGGVDSSVAALALKEQGYEVIGVFMKNWEEEDEDGACTAVEDYYDVRRVCDRLDIPYYSVNFSKEYWDRVFEVFLREYAAGRTPNPDILCNSEIKFKAFLDFALKAGSRAIATGHYARTEVRKGKARLLRAADLNKAQTYFLAGLSQAQLSRAMFPIGGMQKPELREIARKAGFDNAEKKDSTGICFIGERKFKRFLMQYLPAKPGDIVTPEGQVVGRHDGLMYYTLGQRRGLGIGGEGQRWFVVDKDLKSNHLIVTHGENHLLYSQGLVTEPVNWIAGEPPAKSFRCGVKHRYRQPDQEAFVEVNDDGRCHIRFEKPQRAVTPGQWAVLYVDDECLGGGIISSRETV